MMRRSLQRLSAVACAVLLGGCGSGAGNNGGGAGGKGPGGNDAGTDTIVSGNALTGNGCAGGTCQNPNCTPLGTAAPIDQYPQIGFELAPTYIPHDTIIPTFDDVPDGATDPSDPTFKVYGAGEYTKTILSFFKAKNLHMDFFLNTNNWCGDVNQDIDCLNTITDILTTQNPANHTVHHIKMGVDLPPVDGVPQGCTDTTTPSCEEEITGVEAVVSKRSNGGRPHLTRFRAPYGTPYEEAGPGLVAVETVVAKHAVAVGWQMDSGDSAECDETLGKPCYTAEQIFNNVVTLIGTAPGQRWGIVLFHGVYPWTNGAVPMLFDPTTGYLAMHNFKLATVEDAICWKYGKHSWEIVQQLTGQARSPN